jgi:hypothetical protein
MIRTPDSRDNLHSVHSTLQPLGAATRPIHVAEPPVGAAFALGSFNGQEERRLGKLHPHWHDLHS